MSINKLLNNFSPEVYQVLRKRFSEAVVRKRSPWWFFKNDVLSGPKGRQSGGAQDGLNRQHEGTRVKSRLSQAEIMDMWRNMDPESKRKYFNMAEFDNIRFREQKSHWIAAVGSLMNNTDCDIDQILQEAPEYKELQNSFLESLDKLHENYDQMIQSGSIRMLYKDAIRMAEQNVVILEADQLAAHVPRDLRPILAKPRRPPSPFILFLKENMKRLQDQRIKGQRMGEVASTEWNSLSKDERLVYEKRYEEMLQHYQESMDRFKSQHENTNCLEKASRERKAFKKSLRKRLRDSSVLPLCVRNGFNFFVKDHKDVRLSDLTEVWRNLPVEEKERYFKLSQDDHMRYLNEKSLYDEINKTLSITHFNKKSSTAP